MMAGVPAVPARGDDASDPNPNRKRGAYQSMERQRAGNREMSIHGRFSGILLH